MPTSDVVKEFVANVGEKEDHTLDELKKLLSESYKSKTKKKASTGEKKAPSAYNIFIRDEIARIKKETPNVNNTEFMSIAASRWREHKEKAIKAP